MEENKKKRNYKRLAIITVLTILILGGIGYLVVGQKTDGVKTYSRSEIAERNFYKQSEIPRYLRGVEILSHTVDSVKKEHRITLKNTSRESIRYIELNVFRIEDIVTDDGVTANEVVTDFIVVSDAWPSGNDSFQSGTIQTITTIDHDINTSHDYMYEITDIEFE